VSVVSGGKTIFCEGKQTSLDYELLNRVVEGIPGDKCTIVPAGSKFTFSIFAEGYFSRNQAVNQKYIVFRDRDFDVNPTENIQLLEIVNSREKVLAFLTHRACVENYLLDANLIHTYWREKYTEKLENPTSKWGHKDSPGVDLISAWIETSARSLQEYQAVRWALGDLLNMSAARKNLKTTWTGESGKLPASLTRQDCQSEALGLINQFRQAVEAVTPDNFEASLVTYQQHFSQEEFWVQKQYLIWFHGKDIQKEMQKQEPNYISLSSFFDWAITQLDITQYPDLMDLRTRIEQL
jgi:hypothetical protein